MGGYDLPEGGYTPSAWSPPFPDGVDAGQASLQEGRLELTFTEDREITTDDPVWIIVWEFDTSFDNERPRGSESESCRWENRHADVTVELHDGVGDPEKAEMFWSGVNSVRIEGPDPDFRILDPDDDLHIDFSR